MLDENLPTFFIRPSSSDNPLSNTIFLTQNGSDLSPEYTLRRPDPNLPASKNCYAVALYDSYNPEVLYAEVLVQPEWTQPTLSQSEIRTQSGVPPPVPIVPESFTIQLYNPDQQVKVRQIAGSWNSSAHWEFDMPQNSFKLPSASALDRSQSDPAALDVTMKVPFKWKRDGKLSKDISCFLNGSRVDGKKSKEPDITVAMFKSGKEQNNLTIYEPNMHRVDVEDVKGLEVVFLLSAAVIKDIYFNASRELFNISETRPRANTNPKRRNSGNVIGGKASTSPPAIMSGAVFSAPPPAPASQIPPQALNNQAASSSSRPPPTNARTQWEIDAETARLKKAVEEAEKREREERERADRKEQKRIKKMLEEEEREERRRQAAVDAETERLKKQYGVPALPPRQNQGQRPHSMSLGQNQQQLPQYLSAPHSQPVPYQRPVSTPYGAGPPQQQGPYLQAPDGSNASASHSGFFGLGGGKKVQKKRSVFF